MKYKALHKQTFEQGKYALVPIRMEDRYLIMQWRNEQLYHLRQAKPLTPANQDTYFEQVVAKLFDQEQPSQLLFSFLEEGKCIGYGGLVHINWVDMHAEISFIMDTKLEQEHFAFYWSLYLGLIQELAFHTLDLHKLFTYAFDLRPQLYPALESRLFIKEAVLKEHCYFEGKYRDVLIHANIKHSQPRLRKALPCDLYATFEWANDPHVRKYAFNSQAISFEDHQKWFLAKINNQDTFYLILDFNGVAAGSIRFDKEATNLYKISYLLDSKFTGRGWGRLLLEEGIKWLQTGINDGFNVFGDVFNGNTASIKSFERLGFSKEIVSDQTLRFYK